LISPPPIFITLRHADDAELMLTSRPPYFLSPVSRARRVTLRRDTCRRYCYDIRAITRQRRFRYTRDCLLRAMPPLAA